MVPHPLPSITPPSHDYPLTLGLLFSSSSFSFNPNPTTAVNISLFSSQPLFHILHLPLRYLLGASDLQANTCLSPRGCHRGIPTQHDRNRPLSLPFLGGPLLLVSQPVMVNTSIPLYKPATQGKLVPCLFYPTGHQISLIFASPLCHRSAISLQLYHRLCIPFLVHCNDFQLISSSNDSCPSPQSSLFTCSFTLLLCNPCLHIHFSMQIWSIFLY